MGFNGGVAGGRIASVDVTVVGSGPNGLAAAVVCARAGLSVQVFEAQPTIGGGARTLADPEFSGVSHDICSAVHPLALASPFLAEFDLPACFFVPTAFIGTQSAFEWDEGLVPMPNLSWDDLREMSRMGFEIGSHTVNHVNMAAVSLDEARRELVESRKTLEDRLGQRVRWFAYPFGGKNNFTPSTRTRWSSELRQMSSHRIANVSAASIDAWVSCWFTPRTAKAVRPWRKIPRV